MKNLLFCFIGVILFQQIAYSQNSQTYHIEDLTPPEKLLATMSSDSLFYKLEKNFYSFSVNTRLVEKGTHPVLAGFLQAYQEHRPVTISPDIIWLLICQGFGQHVNNNSETLRNKFVNFQGQRELDVRREVRDLDIKKFPWESVFPEFVEDMEEFVGKELTEALAADFTTTTVASKIVSQITIMESVKHYFKYKIVMAGCGIPSVTIEGSLEDWEKINMRLDVLAKYDLKWWIDELRPILNQIIKAKKGKFDKKFWMNMVRYHDVGFYGSLQNIDGWLVKFFPYLNNHQRSNLKLIKNVNEVPDEIVRVPFVFQDVEHQITYNMEFWAGFMGLSQDEKTFSLKPVIGWAVNKLE